MEKDVGFDLKNSKIVTCLIKMSFFDKKDELNRFDIERKLGYKFMQPDLRDVFKILIDRNVLIQTKTIFKIPYFRIDIIGLRDFIDELNCCNEWFDYFDRHHTITWHR